MGARRTGSGELERAALRFTAMQALKAHVHQGRLVVDEPTDLPEGEVIYLVAIARDADLDDEERERLDASLELSAEQARAGRLVDADDVIAKLLAHG